MVMEDILEKQKLAYKVIETYNNKYNVNVPIEIHFVDSIETSWRQYAKRDKVLRDFENGDYTDMNGICMPFDGEKYHIHILNSHDEFPTTVLHEYTHAVDYERFRVEYNDGRIDIENNMFYKTFYVYSEFHAYSNAHHLYLLTIDENKRYEVYLQEIDAIIEGICELIDQSIAMRDIDFYYKLMRFLGKLNALQIMGFDISKAFDADLNKLFIALSELLTHWTVDNLIRLRKIIWGY